jgi:uncharacterized protein (DUF1778 family)
MQSDVQTGQRIRIEIKLSEKQKALFVDAAKRLGQGLSEFVRSSAEEKARSVLNKAR